MTEQLNRPADRPARILIVDDEPLNVDYLEQELDGLGFVTESAADGLEALECVAASPPDLILLDVMMPEMDGISAVRILKDDPETRLIPVVLMTALKSIEDRVRGIEAGADDFLSKPVDERELLARVKTALAVKRAIDETVNELQSAAAHLERYGRQEREVAVLAIAWRLKDARLPEEAVGFLGRHQRTAAEEQIRILGGMTGEGEDSLLVAAFDGTDARERSVVAVEAASAVLAEGWSAGPGGPLAVVVNAAVSVGLAQVGSTRTSGDGEARWAYTVKGEPVEQASDLVRAAGPADVVVTSDVARLVSARFRLEPAGEGAYRVLTAIGPDEAALAHPTSTRRMTTILVTDIVGSTSTAERIGDRAWGELVAAHERATRVELAVFGGEEINTAGDGFLMSFDSPARAIQCALAVRGRLESAGLAIRAGVHTGEVELIEGKALGIALHIATRIAAKANPGEVMVSGTTRELATGSGLIFTDRGEHVLKGVTDPKRLYAALDLPTLPSDQPTRRGSESSLSPSPPVVSVGIDTPTAW